VSLLGFGNYDGTNLLRGFAEGPMDTVNNFLFWRDFLFGPFVSFIIGARVVEAGSQGILDDMKGTSLC
jgi:hypothetical protein